MTTAKNVKPTPAGKYPLGNAKDNKDASVYAKPHKMSGAALGSTEVDLGVCYATDPNTMSSAESTPGGMPARTVSIGNKTRGPKTEGITMRGYGAATKGIKSRGPMA